MTESPLEPPREVQTLNAFLRRFTIDPQGEPTAVLRQTVAAFARLPYENLTKIIKEYEVGRGEAARRTPAEVIAGSQRFGAGGTCFSLTAALLHLVRGLGFWAEPILADRRYGANTHSALLVWIDERPHLLDPGYLLVEPIPLSDRPQTIATTFNEIILTPHAGGERLDLATRQGGGSTYRLTFKTAPADPGEFLRAWDASFDWDMMRYPLLTRTREGEQLYLRGGRLQARRRGEVRREEIPPGDLPVRIAREFGVAPQVAAKAIAILRRQGERV